MDFKLLIILIILIISVIIIIIYSSNNKTKKNEKNEISRRKEADDIADIMTKIINKEGIKENFDKYYNNDYQIDHLIIKTKFVDKNGKYIYFIKRNLYENITKLMEEELKGIKFCGNIINDLKIKPKVTVKDDYDKSVYITVKTSIENTEGCRSLYNDDEIFHLSIHSGRRPEILNQSEIHLKINGFNNEKESWDLYKEGDDYKFKYYVKN